MSKSKRLRSPVWTFGGKGRMVAKILPYLTAWPHQTYVEPFGGGASLLMAKPASPVEVYNDINSRLITLFRVLADPESFEAFYRRVALLPYSRELFEEYRETADTEPDQIMRAVKIFYVMRGNMSGRGGAGWGFVVSWHGRGMAGSVSSFLSCLEMLPEIHARLQRVQIDHKDWRKVLATYDRAETLFYLDPPYVHSTRSSGSYLHELSDEDHRDLVQACLSLEGQAVLSGYPHEIYQPLVDAGWGYVEWKTSAHAAARTQGTGILGKGAATKKQARTEALWVSPKVRDAAEMTGVMKTEKKVEDQMDLF